MDYVWRLRPLMQGQNHQKVPKRQDSRGRKNDPAAIGDHGGRIVLGGTQFAGAILRGTIIFRVWRSPSTVNW